MRTLFLMPFASSLQCRIGMYSLHLSQAAHPSRSLSWYSQHEATGSFTTPPWMEYLSKGYPLVFLKISPIVRRYLLILLRGERRCESKLICPKTQLNDPARSRAQTSWPAVQRTNHQATGPFILFMKSPYFDHFLFLSFTLNGTTQKAKYKNTKESKHQQRHKVDI